MKPNFKNINKYLKRAYRQDQKNYAREKKRCKKEYIDWEDNEFNRLDNKFIWGIDLTHPDQEHSFYTWNDAYVYYNRKDRMYYMEIDLLFSTDIDPEAAAWMELDRLLQIDEVFGNFLVENNLRLRAENLPFWHLDLKAETLTQLYTRFRILLEGYKYYLNNKPQE